jgi:hypothetical protein
VGEQIDNKKISKDAAIEAMDMSIIAKTEA